MSVAVYGGESTSYQCRIPLPRTVRRNGTWDSSGEGESRSTVVKKNFVFPIPKLYYEDGASFVDLVHTADTVDGGATLSLSASSKRPLQYVQPGTLVEWYNQRCRDRHTGKNHTQTYVLGESLSPEKVEAVKRMRFA
uniref:Uncharacterized protein n=1 Tax=Lygus hesperus TaxID=30085 RepID=A0A146LJG8_LYGHE